MKTIEVAAAIIEHNGTFFITQRAEGEFAGMWEFPGGKTEPEESPEQTIVREIREELSTGISVDRYVTTVEYDYPAFHLRMHCFLCSLPDDEHPRLNVHSAARWVTPDEASALNFLPADYDIVSSLHTLIRNSRS
ncbi:MAG: (deoxy)nucleoside triphosphate pyrophosphohydrolase [Bacteroidales bacterium]|nr:(deoxy)nucleoside triphosphate pyrophosphohydrolase [Bacteroidales bacterium]